MGHSSDIENIMVHHTGIEISAKNNELLCENKMQRKPKRIQIYARH